jgi:hypothetical protein
VIQKLPACDEVPADIRDSLDQCRMLLVKAEASRREAIRQAVRQAQFESFGAGLFCGVAVVVLSLAAGFLYAG